MMGPPVPGQKRPAGGPPGSPGMPPSGVVQGGPPVSIRGPSGPPQGMGVPPGPPPPKSAKKKKKLADKILPQKVRELVPESQVS